MSRRTDAGRPPWDHYAIGIAFAVAERADCTRRAVGAVLMRPDHTIVATGYNGGPPNGPSCLRGECPRGLMSTEEVPSLVTSYDVGLGACIAIHAEQNALLRATWDEMHNGILYVTCEPCATCQRLILGSPIQRVVWPAERIGDEPLRLISATVNRGRWQQSDKLLDRLNG